MNKNPESLIAKLDEKIIQSHKFDTELFARLTEAQRKSGIMHGDRPICPFVRPHFMPRSLYQKVVHASAILAQAFEHLCTVALESREIMQELDLTEKEEFMARINPRYKSLCVSSRLDSFMYGEDFKFLEYNAESPAGVGDQLPLEMALAIVPEVREFLSAHPHWRPRPHERLLESLLKSYREYGGQKEKPNIAIVDWRDVDTISEFHILQNYFESKGYNTIIADPRDLEYDGESLRVGDFVIDIFYKRVIIHEFLGLFDEKHPFSRAYIDGNVMMANSFRVKIVHKKAGLAILSDEKYRHLFNSEQLKVIHRHIPWTRRARECKTTYQNQEIDLFEYLRRNREGFLLKPNDDYGGHGITFGWESTESEWEMALEDCLQSTFIVQERVPVGKIDFPTYNDSIEIKNLLIDFDPFLFCGQVEGGLARMSAQSLVNITQGGGETALIVLEDY
jgi:hypothetical protein